MAAKTYRNTELRKKALESAIDGAKTLVVFDTETTGLTKKDQVIQFAGIKFDISKGFGAWTEIDRLNMLIRPDEPVSQIITDLTGITNEELNTHPFEDYNTAKTISDFLCSADMAVAHNAPFDISMIGELFKRQSFDTKLPPVIDTLPIARDILSMDELSKVAKKIKEEFKEQNPGQTIKMGPHKLACIRRHLVEKGMIPDTELRYHDAMEDVSGTAEVAEVLFAMDLEKEKIGHNDRWQLMNARMWCNPSMNSMNRYLLTIKKDGEVVKDIFYDADALCWSYAASKLKAAEKRHLEEIFDNVDFDALEQDVVSRFGKMQAVLGESEIPATTIDAVVIPLHWEKRKDMAEKDKDRNAYLSRMSARPVSFTPSPEPVVDDLDEIELD